MRQDAEKCHPGAARKNNNGNNNSNISYIIKAKVVGVIGSARAENCESVKLCRSDVFPPRFLVLKELEKGIR